MNNFDLRKYLAEGRLKVNEGDMDHLMQDLERELKQHDWFYYMADDPRTYDKGTNEQGELKRLLKMLNNSPEAVALYNRYAPVQDGIDLRIKEEKGPDYPDVDKDGDTEESMEKALKDKESIKESLRAYNVIDAKGNTIHEELPYDKALEIAKKLNQTEEGDPYKIDATDRLAFKEGDYDPDQEQLDDEDEIFMPMDDEGRPLEEALNPEVVKAVNRLIKGLAKKYDYSERDAVFAIQAALKQREYDNVNEGYYGSSDIDNIASTLGYDDIDSFFNDNPGAVDAIMQWAETVPDFGRMLQDAGMMQEDLDLGHQDNEPGMLKGDLYKIGNYAMELYQMMDDLEGIDGEVDLPHWWQSKVTTAKNMISGAKHYLEFELKEPAIDSMVSEAAPEEEDEFHRELDKLVHKTFGHSSDEKKEMKEYMSLEDQAKVYFMQKVKRGEIDELPEDPKAAFLAQMTKDQMDHDRETLDREGGLGEASFYTKNVKDKVISKLMDQLKK